MPTSELIRTLAFRANLDPQAIAVQGTASALNFRQLQSWVQRVAQQLRTLGLRPGQVAVTTFAGPEIEWIVTLALAHEAVTSCSAPDRGESIAKLAHDWRITDDPSAPADEPGLIRIDNAWLNRLAPRQAGLEPREWPSADSVARIVLTSGTTGSRKAVAMTEAIVIGRAMDTLRNRGCVHNFSLMGLTSAAHLSACVTALMGGTPLYTFRTQEQAFDLIERCEPDGIFGSPLQIGGLVKRLAANGRRLQGVRIVRFVGATAGPQLIESVAKLITPNILNLYGSTEAGAMGARRCSPGQDPALVGVPDPRAQIQIVGDDDQPLPAGTEGRVRLRTPLMVQSYLGDVEASRQSFRGGWFYPGDRGYFTQDGMLALAGREGEVLNRGGIKFNAAVQDEFIASFAGVKDAAVFVTTGAGAAAGVAAALVADEGFDMRALRQALAERFGAATAPSAFMKLQKIPRTANGKVQRAQLARAFEKSRVKSA